MVTGVQTCALPIFVSLLVNAARDVVTEDQEPPSRSVHDVVNTATGDRPTSGATAQMNQSPTPAQNGENVTPTPEQHVLLRSERSNALLSPAAAARAWTDPTWRHDELALMREHALDMIRAQREALLDAGDEGLYSADSLEHALDRLDFQEIMLTSEPH